ncbi:putative transcriptional regulatory protein C15D4.02 [Pseudocercospora fuligena]|uniref:Putative transcriptional regulatory protein C15D4.02 n=1 Tax=Pseudocercospora fuligena TaxID=685502 RepID=A0A8H6RWM6_9PEZI|nr:putative transcriptional regulatory protein C15D4.02 [Pseudocercospora fuligena]
MASNIKTEDGFHHGSMPDTSAAEAALKAKLSRKRTKTGCLTCRKRRIKCGEERPVCKNCIKSKRHCEGYNQRVVFKPPQVEYQPIANGAAHITFPAGPFMETQQTEVPAPPLDPSMYGQLRPRPAEQQFMTAFDTHTQQFVRIPVPPQQVHHPSQMPPNEHFQPFAAPPVISPGHVIQDPFRTHQYAQQVAQPTYQQQDTQGGPAPVQNVPGSNGIVSPATDNHMATAVTMAGDHLGQTYGQPVQPHAQQHTPHVPPGRHSWMGMQHSTDQEHVASVPTPASSRTMSFSQTPQVASQQWTPNAYIPRPELSRPLDYQPEFQHAHYGVQQNAHVKGETADHTTPEYYDHEYHAPQNATPTYLLNAAAVGYQDDDYYDIHSDEEQDVDTAMIQGRDHQRQRTLNRILARNQISGRDLQIRRYDTFLYAGILDKYKVENVANPLKNPATARVFAHFISATGPSLSIFERHPRNTSVLFHEGSIPLSQQGLWTYTLPMAALHHQGLLHAMLALASLHIARLQDASVTPSMQHYAWALKRVHASVSNPQSRLKLTTIAASMLLGFYEVMTADHMKWNMHLAGAKQLFVETDFVKMTQEFRQLKIQRAATYQARMERSYSSPASPEAFSQDDLLDQIPDIDERLVSEMVGREVRYGGYGRVEAPPSAIPPELDLSKFEILKDLYWWYCKQDVYQSIVSGNALLMDFNRWANCPPRAPMGKVDAVHGSFDHLVLLLGRIADFSSKDRERKLKQIQANGGRWKPLPGTPGMNIWPPPPQGNQPPTPVSASFPPPGNPFPSQGPPAGEPPPMPAFYGMAPPPRANVQMPASYTPFGDHAIPTPQSAQPPDPLDTDLAAATQASLAEYGRIRSALHTFANSLGPGFQPLSAAEQIPMATAFGDARSYRSYDIGCLWAIYNMAIIITIRSHPHMPPAMHMAAGIAAPETAPYATEIGRIVAGIVPGPSDTGLNPSLGAALCESCMPSFFAAVQYQEPAQRWETVTRIFNIAKRTGWGSAELIANGCETAWVKAAAIGRGPPYTRIVRSETSEDPRLNGSWERLDPNAQPNENDESDRRLVKTKANARLNWAVGVIGVEEDIDRIRISDR